MIRVPPGLRDVSPEVVGRGCWQPATSHQTEERTRPVCKEMQSQEAWVKQRGRGVALKGRTEWV